jgi:hypothetical protein
LGSSHIRPPAPAALPTEARQPPVTEDTASGQKSNALRGFKCEAGAASGHDVNDELGMLPVFELCCADVEFAAGDFAEKDVLRADAELAGLEAHRGRTVAASARLVKHQRPMLQLELRNELTGLFREENSRDHGSRPLRREEDNGRGPPPRPCDFRFAQKKPSALAE